MNYPIFSDQEQYDHRQRLADILEQVPKAEFDMSDYAKSSDGSCNTVACALGHAALSGQFEGMSAEMVEVSDSTYGPWYRHVLHVDGFELHDASWYSTGHAYFGSTANSEIFHTMFGKSKTEVIAALRSIPVNQATYY